MRQIFIIARERRFNAKWLRDNLHPCTSYIKQLLDQPPIEFVINMLTATAVLCVKMSIIDGIDRTKYR